MPDAIDYDNVTAADLEMQREPRKSKVKVRHIPSGNTAENPVCPNGNLTEARFRRPNVLPKENRQKGMTGYIEGDKDTEGLWVIIGEIPTDEGFKNEYLEALALDPVALKASFEGRPKEATKPSKEDKKPSKPESPQQKIEQTSNDAVATLPAVPEAPSVEPTEPVTADEEKELDDLLAGLDA